MLIGLANLAGVFGLDQMAAIEALAAQVAAEAGIGDRFPPVH